MNEKATGSRSVAAMLLEAAADLRARLQECRAQRCRGVDSLRREHNLVAELDVVERQLRRAADRAGV